MNFTKPLFCGFLLTFLIPTAVMAQGFGEYGRTLGGVTQQGRLKPSAPGGFGSGGKSGRVGDIGGHAVPSRLIVAGQQAVLFPRQDDQAEKITNLADGEILVPLLQTAGGNDWYMVKTQKGLIGWVKASDVQEQSAKK